MTQGVSDFDGRNIKKITLRFRIISKLAVVKLYSATMNEAEVNTSRNEAEGYTGDISTSLNVRERTLSGKDISTSLNVRERTLSGKDISTSLNVRERTLSGVEGYKEDISAPLNVHGRSLRPYVCKT
jgi:hypothetical protein